MWRGDRAGAPPVDAGEQEQPDDVDEVPVPRGGLEAEMAFRREVVGARAEPANDQEAGPHDDMEAVEAGGEEEGGWVNPAPDELERRVRILDRLTQREAEAEQDGQAK